MVLDVDSDLLNDFSEVDAEGLGENHESLGKRSKILCDAESSLI